MSVVDYFFGDHLVETESFEVKTKGPFNNSLISSYSFVFGLIGGKLFGLSIAGKILLIVLFIATGLIFMRDLKRYLNSDTCNFKKLAILLSIIMQIVIAFNIFNSVTLSSIFTSLFLIIYFVGWGVFAAVTAAMVMLLRLTIPAIFNGLHFKYPISIANCHEDFVSSRFDGVALDLISRKFECKGKSKFHSFLI